MPRSVLSADAVRRLAIKKIRVEASGRLGFQLIKYPGGHMNKVPKRMGGVAMFEYIGFQKVIAQKLWLRDSSSIYLSVAVVGATAKVTAPIVLRVSEIVHKDFVQYELFIDVNLLEVSG